MKITNEILLDMGFSKIPNSSNPVYYIHSALDTYLLGMNKNGVCRFKYNTMDSSSDEQDLIDVQDVVSYMVYKAEEIGKRARSKEIKALIG